MTLSGIDIIKTYVKTLPLKPGVYRMVSEEGQVLYVGKAKSLRNRVVSYTRSEALPLRLQRMVHRTRSMEFVVTETEWEALLLEATLIKRFQPPYNVLFKDDKAYPYLMLTGGELPARLMIYRGVTPKKGESQFFGPFASVGAVHQTLDLLLKTFRLRTCADTVYQHRKRPCLEYDMKRCTAPCVGKISSEDYEKNVEKVVNFLSGKTQDIQKALREEMLRASARQDFEQAALLRDQAKSLEKIQEEQGIRLDRFQDTDVVVLTCQDGITAIQVFFFRHGWNYGNHSFFPTHDIEEDPSTILEKFLTQFYLEKPIPKEIITNISVSSLLQKAFQEKTQKTISMMVPKRGDRKRLVEMAVQNAREALSRKMALASSQKTLLEGVQKLFELERFPERIEIYDNSHTQGAVPYGAMVVATPEGFDKKSYRTFSIQNAKQRALQHGGDDYAMMEEVLTRRLSNKDLPKPDLILLDGGIGHLRKGLLVLENLSMNIPIVAIAKGADRHAGREWFYQKERDPFQLPVNGPILHYLQRLRDEAHRFAIGTHRRGRTRESLKSLLETIEGVGPKRRRALLLHFQTVQAMEGARVEDFQKVEGINEKLAQVLYTFFHP